MKRTLLIGLALGAILHGDWHMARPVHHRWSLGLSYHWAVTGVVFAIAGCLIARRWPSERWRVGAWSLIVAVVVAQVLEPVLLEGLYYGHKFAYEVEPERWVALGQSLAASIPAYALTLWLCVKRPTAMTQNA
jgi:hypothetical protein